MTKRDNGKEDGNYYHGITNRYYVMLWVLALVKADADVGNILRNSGYSKDDDARH